VVTPTAATVKPGSFKLTRIASGLKQPVYATGAGDGSGRLFVVEQPGRIRVIKDGRLLPAPFLDIRRLVSTAGSERGLLSVAFHPDFATNGIFVVDYTRAAPHAGDTVIARYYAAPGSDVADAGSGRQLLTIFQPQANHNGGLVKFGPDGRLYIGMGDGGAAGDTGPGHAPQGNGQSLSTLLGKILRVDVGFTGGYTVPADNPRLAGARPEIWAYGLRNPWRFSFDRATGDMYIGDVGQNAWEEVDFRPAGDRGGENYGWPVLEATHVYRSGASLKGDTKPVAEYAHVDANCSVTGGYVYRGQRVPSMQGFYVFGDYCSGVVRTLVHFAGHWRMATLADTAFLISSFGEDDAGELYLVDLGGSVYRFDPA